MRSEIPDSVRQYHDPKGSMVVAFLALSTVMFACLGEWALGVGGAITTLWMAHALYKNERRWRDTSGGGER